MFGFCSKNGVPEFMHKTATSWLFWWKQVLKTPKEILIELVYSTAVDNFLPFHIASKPVFCVFQVNYGNTSTMCEICSKSTRGVSIVIFEQISHTLFWCFHCWIGTRKCQLRYNWVNIVYLYVLFLIKETHFGITSFFSAILFSCLSLYSG